MLKALDETIMALTVSNSERRSELEEKIREVSEMTLMIVRKVQELSGGLKRNTTVELEDSTVVSVVNVVDDCYSMTIISEKRERYVDIDFRLKSFSGDISDIDVQIKLFNLKKKQCQQILLELDLLCKSQQIELLEKEAEDIKNYLERIDIVDE